MLRLLYKELANKEEYFKLAIRTECNIKMPISDDVVIYFDDNSSIDGNWRFWMDDGGLIIFFGTLEEMKDIEGAYGRSDIPEKCLRKIISNLGLISEQMKTTLPELLYNHIINWEDRIPFESDASCVEIGPNAQISLKEAKRQLSSHYQLLMDYKEYLDSSNAKNVSALTLMQYKIPSGENGIVHFNPDRNSFMTKINDNCVEEIEAAILHIIIQKIETQDFLTIGQLGLLKFLKNHASSN